MPGAGPEYAGIYLHARYYDPRLGIFLSPDPIGVEGGTNLYAYALGDPVNGTDRSGLQVAICQRDEKGCRPDLGNADQDGFLSTTLSLADGKAGVGIGPMFFVGLYKFLRSPSRGLGPDPRVPAPTGHVSGKPIDPYGDERQEPGRTGLPAGTSPPDPTPPTAPIPPLLPPSSQQRIIEAWTKKWLANPFTERFEVCTTLCSGDGGVFLTPTRRGNADRCTLDDCPAGATELAFGHIHPSVGGYPGFNDGDVAVMRGRAVRAWIGLRLNQRNIDGIGPGDYIWYGSPWTARDYQKHLPLR